MKCDKQIDNKRAIVLIATGTIALLLFCTMFLSFEVFVEAEIISKWYAFIEGSSLYYLVLLLIIKKQKINIDLITILTTIFIGYLLLISLLSPFVQNNAHILSIISFILLYFLFKIIPYDCLKNINIVIFTLSTAQACYGLMQYIGIFNTYKVFNIVGSFENPAGFSASLVAGVPFCLSVIHRGGWRSYLGIIALLIMIVSVILSGSRAGIIAIILAFCIYWGYRYYHVVKKYHEYFILFFIILLLTGVGLFLLKKDSALGRVLIWINSYSMILDRPISGSGSGFFLGSYMQYQADYFEQNPDSQYSILADNVTHPLNEYILLTIEYGILGMLLLLAVVFVIIKYSKQFTFHHLCLLSIGIFACFSYPLRYPFVLIVVAYSLTNIKLKEVLVLRIKALGKIMGVMLIGFIFVLWMKDIRFEKNGEK